MEHKVEVYQGRMLPADNDDFRAKFPLHSLVWENDYRNLEKALPTVCVINRPLIEVTAHDCVLQ